MHPLDTPVALILFNRPEKTARVFEAIRKAKPKQLFIIADGPRNEAEKTRTDAARAATEKVDWDCEVKRKYEDKNLGVKKGPPAGLTWLFNHVEHAIILEDDCLPDPGFFPYCTELLERYKDESRIMQISGDNFQQGNPDFVCKESYYFSVSPQLWGWATWRRAWQKYDERPMDSWPEFKNSTQFKNIFPDAAVRAWWEKLFERNYQGDVDTWEGPWLYACISNGGVCINSKTNLVTNIGMDPEAIHWREGLSLDDENANIPIVPLTFPLVHPDDIRVDVQADAYSFKRQQNINRYVGQKVRWFFRSHFPALYETLKRLARR